MPSSKAFRVTSLFDLPLFLAIGATVAFYAIVKTSLHDTWLHRYTTEHFVEYVIVSFFFWGIMDALCRASNFPLEWLAIDRIEWPTFAGRVPLTEAAHLRVRLNEMPQWQRDSRLAKRLSDALTYVETNGAPDEFAEYLWKLEERDDDQTHANYGLVRFICWLMPVLGFLGTVVHFGSALTGLSVDNMTDDLPKVVGQMGAAFNTTTIALGTAVVMMFVLFQCERLERRIVRAVDRRAEWELLNRFERPDPSVAPFLSIVEAGNRTNLRAIEQVLQQQADLLPRACDTIERQSEAHQSRQAALWQSILDQYESRQQSVDGAREQRLLALLDSVQAKRSASQAEADQLVERIAGLSEQLGRFVDGVATVARDDEQLVRLQATLSDNLRVLHETHKMDEAIHGLTAAIHLLTSRHRVEPISEAKPKLARPA